MCAIIAVARLLKEAEAASAEQLANGALKAGNVALLHKYLDAIEVDITVQLGGKLSLTTLLVLCQAIYRASGKLESAIYPMKVACLVCNRLNHAAKTKGHIPQRLVCEALRPENRAYWHL
jgi:hypothetical protein